MTRTHGLARIAIMNLQIVNIDLMFDRRASNKSKMTAIKIENVLLCIYFYYVEQRRV